MQCSHLAYGFAISAIFLDKLFSKVFSIFFIEIVIDGDYVFYVSAIYLYSGTGPFILMKFNFIFMCFSSSLQAE